MEVDCKSIMQHSPRHNKIYLFQVIVVIVFQFPLMTRYNSSNSLPYGNFARYTPILIPIAIENVTVLKMINKANLIKHSNN